MWFEDTTGDSFRLISYLFMILLVWLFYYDLDCLVILLPKKCNYLYLILQPRLVYCSVLAKVNLFWYLQFILNLKSGIILRGTTRCVKSHLVLKEPEIISEIHLRFAEDLPEICLRFAHDLPVSCPRCVRDLPEICLIFAPNLPMIWPRLAWYFP